MQEILLKVRYFDIFQEDYRKAYKRIIKKVTLLFLFFSQSLSMKKIVRSKRSLELVITFFLQPTKQVQKISFINYVLSDKA